MKINRTALIVASALMSMPAALMSSLRTVQHPSKRVASSNRAGVGGYVARPRGSVARDKRAATKRRNVRARAAK